MCRQSNEDDKKLSSRLKVVQASLGAGVHKKLILGGAAFKDDDKKRIRSSMNTVDGVGYEKDYYGPWAWFKLMTDSRVKQTGRSNVYELTFEIGRSGGGNSRRIIYEARTKTAGLPIDSRLFDNFKVPESL